MRSIRVTTVLKPLMLSEAGQKYLMAPSSLKPGTVPMQNLLEKVLGGALRQAPAAKAVTSPSNDRSE